MRMNANVKNVKSSRHQSKGGIIKPKLKVKKTISSERVDEIADEIREFTYGQCLTLKLALDRRLAATRAIIR